MTEGPSLNQRALLVARMPTRGTGNVHSPLPSRTELAIKHNVGRTSVEAAARILREGSPLIVKVVEGDLIPMRTVVDRVLPLPPDVQDNVATRILNGARWHSVLSRKAVVSTRPRISKEKNSPHLRREAVAGIRDALAGLHHLVERTDGLDPEITPDEAAGWLRDLARERKYLVRLTEMLKERTK